MYFKLVLVFTSFLYILFCYLDITAFDNGVNHPAAAQYSIGDAAINCGSVGKSTALDGREWIGDAPSKFLSGKSRSSTAAQKSFSIDPVPYKTSRISAAGFRYTFKVNPGQKFIRLHFYPASYHGFENSVDFFTVKAGHFTLLRDFSASLTADISGVKYVVKEFLLIVEENTKLNITFSPSHSSKSKENIYAFVNGIEIISMPAGLYYTPDGDLGARIVSKKNHFYSIDDSTALELIHRLNIGGSSISSAEDLGMFRRWSEDSDYLIESGVHRVNYPAHRIKYTNMRAFIAPPKLYQTSWKTRGNIRVKQTYNFKWKIPIELSFGYLIRLHFCELDDGMAESELREFSVLINNQIAETQADVIRWSGGNGIPVYRDYMVKMKGDNKGGSKCDLLISLQSANELVFGLLNGLEIFKLSNLDNSLATPNPTIPKRVSTSSSLNIRNMFLAFGQCNVIATGMTILVILVNVIVYYSRQIWEKKFNLENDTQAATTEPSYRHFSLAEIISATQNFSDAFVVGRGGFGKVYRAYIPAISETVALKRLNSNSRQGAREFWTEIDTLSKLRHIHLVSLIGYCNQGQEMILVYEYMPCGTLADNLYKMSRKGKDIDPLSWEQRLRICIGAARGLEYLHTGSGYGVIHRDVKDSNILLDENFVAKISDFGLSKVEKVSQSKSYVSTKVKGTPGYLDPDYLTTHRLTRKSDVYSFGVVLLVVLAGKPAVDIGTPEGPQSLLSCFRECKGDVERIVDPCLQGKYSPNSLREFVKSAENCLHNQAKKRPTMAKVVASLELALQLQQHESTMNSASGDAIVVGQHFEEGTLESIQILQGSDVPSPTEGSTTKHTNQDLALPTTRGEDCAPVRKSLWRWPWKAIWNRVGTSDISTIESLQYKLSEIQAATNNFAIDNRIGEGGFGPVYKGSLPNGRLIAVKRLSRSPARGVEEFKNEIALVARLQHRNLVRLLGFCFEREEHILIYEFVPNRSLAHFLFDPEKQQLLNWSRRYKIIAGIARGLLYLHEDSRLKIVHRDLKASNVLLDTHMNPNIADFEMARLLEIDQSEGNTSIIAGEFDYLAPEYVMHGLFSVKSDVFSFGVLILEIASGKKNRFYQADGSDDLLSYAWRQWRDGTPLSLVDTSMGDSYSRNEVIQSIHIGLLCVQENVEQRPTMASVVLMLNSYSITLPTPNPPAFFNHSSTQNFNHSSTQNLPEELPQSDNEASITELYPR